MENLKTITNIVRVFLENEPKTRNSDSYLYLKVLEYVSKEEGFALSYMTVPYFLEHMKEYGFPPFESVRRTRQKLQQTYPELAAADSVQTMRHDKEAVYLEYVRDANHDI